MDRAQGTVGQFQSSPPEVRIRTFASDLRSIHEAGTGLPQFQNIPVPPPRSSVFKKPFSKILIYLALGVFILIAVGVAAYLISTQLN